MQMGKGRDVGMLQINVFEGKISAGTAISMGTRDAFRVSEGMDFARLISYYHTCGGFYISNCLIVASFMTTLYYMASLALTRIDAAIAGSKTIYLLGEVSFLQVRRVLVFYLQVAAFFSDAITRDAQEVIPSSASPSCILYICSGGCNWG